MDSTDIVKTTKDELDQNIVSAAEKLTALAETLDDDLKARVLDLAQFTDPTIKGVVGPQQVTVPIINIRQKMSESNIPEDCKIGELFSSAGEALGNSIRVIPVLMHTVRKKWATEGIDCASLDGKTGSRYGECGSCPHGRFEKGVSPDCSPGHSFYVVTEDLSALYRVDFLKSNAKAGRNILRLAARPALWSRSFVIGTDQQTNKAAGGTYYTFKTSPTGRKTDAQTMRICDALHDFFQAVYQHALLAQTEYAKRLAEQTTVEMKDSSVVINDDGEGVIDFSESL